MPSTDKTISIIFEGKDNVSRAIQGMSRSFSQLESMVEGVAGPFARIGDGVLAADAALGALAIGGLTYAYKKSMDFESATAELAKVLGDEIDQLEAAKKNALELSNQYGRTSTSVLEATAGFKQAGYTVKEAMDLTRVSLDLAIAGELDAAQASELLVASLKGFKAPASEATRLVDILNETSNNYATDLEQLAIGMAGISPIAEKMGFSFEETAGLVTPVIEVFRSGSEASRALKTGLLKLTDDTGAVTAALNRLGISQTDVNGSLRSGRDILADVSKAFQSASEADKLFLTQQLVGIDQSAKMVEVFDGLNKRLAITETAMGAAGSAALEVETRLATSEVAVDRFGVAFENAAIRMGNNFRVAATEAVEGGTDILNVLGELAASGTFNPLFDAIESYGRELGAFLGDIAEAMPEAFESVDWSGLLSALDALVDEFGELFDGIDLRTAEGLGDAMQAVADTIESLIRVTQGMLEYLDPLWDAIREGISRFNELDDSSKRAAGEFLGAAEVVAKAGAKIFGVLVSISKSGADIKDVFDVVAGALKLVWNNLEIVFSRMLQLVTNVVKAMTFIPEKLSGFLGLEGMSEGLTKFRDELSILNDTLQDEVAKNADEAAQALGQLFDGLDGKAKEARKAQEDAAKATSDAWFTAADDFDAIVADIAGTLETRLPQKQDVALTPRLDEEAVAETAKKAQEVSRIIEDSVERDLGIIKAETERFEAVLDYRLGVLKEEGETVREIARGVADSFSAAESTLGDLTKTFAGLGLGEDSWNTVGKYFEIRDQIRHQQQIAQQLADAQTENLAAQTKLAEARAEQVSSGEASITINADGLEPELEAFMWQILERIQIRATEEGASFLLGM